MLRRGHRFQIGLGILFFLAGLLLGGAGLAFVRAGAIYDYQDSVDGAKIPDVDAIVVLAGGRGRISAAGDFWYRYHEAEQTGQTERTPILYISGMGERSNWNTLGAQVRRGVLSAMQPQDVVLETESVNTEENAIFVAKNARLRGWKKIVLMTSPYHMRRAKLIFARVLKQAGVPLDIETITAVQDPYTADEWRESLQGVRVTMFEYLKWLYYSTVWKPAPVDGR